MFDTFQLAVAFGVIVALSGPEDLKRYARIVGKMTGRAVGYAKAARGELDTVVDRSKVDEMQKELHETLSQLEAIRHELSSGFSVMGGARAPTREVYADPPPTSPPPTPQAATPQAAAGAPAYTSSPPSYQPRTNSTIASPVAASELAAPSPAPSSGVARSYIVNQRILSSTRSPPAFPSFAARGVELVTKGIQSSYSANHPQPAEVPLNVVPVSAVAANRIPQRTGPLSGADIILEGVEEMRVAAHALEFLQQEAAKK